jgi:hypothetical protein
MDDQRVHRHIKSNVRDTVEGKGCVRLKGSGAIVPNLGDSCCERVGTNTHFRRVLIGGNGELLPKQH